jgi:rubrerythrin
MKKIRTLEEAIDFAIKHETDAYNMYRKMATDTDNGHTRDILLGFAIEEEAHIKKLEIIKNNHTEDQLRNVHEVFFTEVYREQIHEGPDMDLKDALLFAMNNEKKSALMYLDMAKRYKDPALKTFFTAMARDEAEHEARFERIYNETFVKTK